MNEVATGAQSTRNSATRDDRTYEEGAVPCPPASIARTLCGRASAGIETGGLDDVLRVKATWPGLGDSWR